MSKERDDGKPEVDVAADTVAGEPPRTASQKQLHDDVKAALFSGTKRRDDLASGTVFAGRYRMLGVIGRGGMGEVHRAHDLELGEDVAIKFLPRAYAGNPALRARFVEEVRLARQITHPNVCRVHDIGEADGRHFLSMELIDGEDLSSLLRRIGRLPQEKALELAQQLCGGLAALHARGVLHRDLKPSNVMIDGEGQLKLADFGLAAQETALRAEDVRDGTPAYMAPEQAAGKEVTAKSDIFALGLVLYELIAGRHAYAVGTDASGKPRIDRDTTPASIATHVRGLPPELDDVLRACLDPDPAARPESVLAVAAALPGGDPVAAAIAAGRAPSVEAVAGAKLVGTLPAWVAYGLALLIGVSVLLFAATASWRSVLGRHRQDLSVDVLMHRAREVLAEVAELPPRADSLADFRVDEQYLEAVAEGAVQDTASPLLFRYRQSSEELLSYGPEPSIADPPMLQPGDAKVVLDGAGLLRSLTIVPGERRSDRVPTDFDALLRLAGLDPQAVTEVAPVEVPRFFADEQRAWTGTIDDTGVDVTVEAAALDGRPIAFVVHPSWDPVSPTVDDDEAGADGLQWARYGITGLLFGFVFLVVTLARRSIKRGDADLRGAWRVGTAVGLVIGLEVFLRAHHSGPFSELRIWSWLVRHALFFGVFTFLCYVIVEPYARRHLPRTMVGWTRLLRGRWRDPLVARDVLVGIVFALAILWAQLARDEVLTGSQPSSPLLDVLFGGRHALGQVAQALWTSVIGILQVYVGYLVIVMIARGRQRISMSVLFVLWALIQYPWTHAHESVFVIVAFVAIALVVAGLVVVLVTRFGLLATVAMQLAANFIMQFPLTLDFDAWYAPFGAISFVGVGALTLFGLRCARPSRP